VRFFLDAVLDARATQLTMATIPDDLGSRTARELLYWFSIAIYEPPISNLRDQMRSLPPALRIPMLILDFDTELSMQGILGFLENSTGLYLAETIDALDAIGAHGDATTLGRISAIMVEHGVTVEQLRANVGRGELYEITTFRKTHGNDLIPMADRITKEAKRLSLYTDAESVRDMLEPFIERHKDHLLAAIQRA
jgi:hypothetical protein